MNRYRICGLVFAGSFGVLFGLGMGATAVDAWGFGCNDRTFPATGQTTPYTANTLKGANQSVADDGTVQAGGPLNYTGTGPTIIDNNTGLEWEVLGQPDVSNIAGVGSIHDWRTLYFYACPSPGGLTGCVSTQLSATPLSYITIWDKVDQMNEGSGYAGHNDWRVPNKKELQSIVHYGIADGSTVPAVHQIFNNQSPGTVVCEPNSTGCSFTLFEGSTDSAAYWTSTTVPDESTIAWRVGFGEGRVAGDDNKNRLHPVRLVRGGCSNGVSLGNVGGP